MSPRQRLDCLHTVFVMDHGPMMAQKCDKPLEVDGLAKSRSGHPQQHQGPAQFMPVPAVCKSLWTCAVEAAFEYCRIVWDIYPSGRLIRFHVSDFESRAVGSWATAHQNLSHLMHHFALIGVPVPAERRVGECSMAPGLSAAVESLLEVPAQDVGAGVHGRVICMGGVRDDNHARGLEQYFHEAVAAANERAAERRTPPLAHVDLIIVDVHPNSRHSLIAQHPRADLSPVLSYELVSVRGSRWLASRFCSLVLQHYELASTTVTGIPMKEEQNASSSANYDVEILHPQAAHADILKLKNESTLFILKEGYDYKTVTLKWCTPRATSNSVEMWPCSSAYRISPVDVTSRPSSCLTNFLLGGRSVMLELPRHSGVSGGGGGGSSSGGPSGSGGGGGNRTTSHMLAAHGGEIFLHSLLIGRSLIEDPPSISEGYGGRVTDYRIPDFGELMKENKLVPYVDDGVSTMPTPTERATLRLERATQYWPLTIGSTQIFNMGAVADPLIKLIVQAELSDDQIIECKKVIYSLVAMESRNEALPAAACGNHHRSASAGQGGAASSSSSGSSSATSGAKGSSRREEQYRLLFNEVELMLRRHCRSDQHRRVLACLLECRTKGTGVVTSSAAANVSAAAAAAAAAAGTGGKSETASAAAAASSDSPMSPPPAKAPTLLDLRTSSSASASQYRRGAGSGGQSGGSLLELFNAGVASEVSRRQRDFVGYQRQNGAKLYVKPEKDALHHVGPSHSQDAS